MSREIDLTLLRTFVTVVETGGMTKASRRLNLTQAAVSRQIKRLEERFQVHLFDRGLKQISLTSSGERMLSHARRLLTVNDEVWGSLTAPEFEGQIKLGVPQDLVPAFMVPILRNFNKAWPRIDITLICDNTTALRKALGQGELDLTLSTESRPSENSTLLLADQLVWVGARDGDAHTRQPLPVTLGDLGCAFRPAVIDALTNVGRDWRFVCSTGDMATMCAAIEADLAIAPLLSQTVPKNLSILGPAGNLPSLPLYFINLYLAPEGISEIGNELARQIQGNFEQRYPPAA